MLVGSYLFLRVTSLSYFLSDPKEALTFSSV